MGTGGRGPRELYPHLVGQFEAAARELREAGLPGEGGWLLVAFVESELRRPGLLHPEAARLALRAADLLQEGRASLAAARVVAAAGDMERAAALLRAGGAHQAASRLAGWGEARLVLGADLPGLTDTEAARSAADGHVVGAGARHALARLRGRGRTDVALMLASALGQASEAARTAGQLGVIAERAEQLSRRGRALEAARGWVAVGQPGRALQDVQRVPSAHEAYREACVLAAGLAHGQDVLTFELDHMLGPFMAVPPRLPEEIEAFRLLAELYTSKGQRGQARGLLSAALHAAPERHDLAAALEALGPEVSSVPPTDGDLPELPSLPSLPSMPMLDMPTEPTQTDQGVPPQRPLARPPRPTGATMVPDGRPQATGPRPAPRGATMVPDGDDDLPPVPHAATMVPAGGTMVPMDGAAAPWGGTMVPDEPQGPAPTLAPDQGDLPTAVGPGGPASTYHHATRPAEEAAQALRPVQPLGTAGAVFAPGAMVAERYRIEAELGEGGMGTVFRALDLELGEPVALKVLTVPVRSEKLIERFRRELRLARRLTHENVVRLHDIGLHQGWRYITMELLQGADLGVRLERGRLSHDQCVEVIAQAAEGLQAAHDQGVVHRDIKPANLFLTDDGRVKVMDFGLAATQGQSGMTQVGMIAGSPAYMAPEQGAGLGNATAASDLYALGIVAYELFTGRVPFHHQDMLALLRLHAEAAPPRPRDLDPSVPEAVERELLRSLSKAPASRHESCRAFAVALREALDQPEVEIEG